MDQGMLSIVLYSLVSLSVAGSTRPGDGVHLGISGSYSVELAEKVPQIYHCVALEIKWLENL